MMQLDYNKTPISFTMTRPDDMHLHIRDGMAMKDAVRYSARQFARGIIMPNLVPPVTTTAMAVAYRERITDALIDKNGRTDFQPLMTLYLTDNTSPDEIDRAKESGFVHAVKLYPAGATTNSDAGVTNIEKVYPVFERMEKLGMVLCVHGEVTDPEVDIFEREGRFIDLVLIPIVDKFPGLKIVLEHITTSYGAVYVGRAGPNIAATITAQHLLCNRNHLLVGGIKPHLYCLPILKREEDRQTLVRAATSGNPKFFAGTDSAPHAKHLKEHACGCAGCFTALHAMELYTEMFEEAKALDKLEGFASHFGSDFYGLQRNEGTVTFVREEWKVPKAVPFGDTVVVPFRAGEKLKWKMK